MPFHLRAQIQNGARVAAMFRFSVMCFIGRTWAGVFENGPTYAPLAHRVMDRHLPCVFPTSCSSDSTSLSDEHGEERACGRSFPSTGTIPILLFDDDAGDLLGSDPASVVANNTTSEGAGSSIRYQDSSSRLGIVESPARVRGSSGELASSGGGSERNRQDGSHPLVHFAFNPADPEPSWPSGPADDHELKGDDDREKGLSLFFDADSLPSSRSRCSCCCSSSSQSSSCSGQPGPLYTSVGQNMRGSCYGSCGTSPAAITNTQLIAATKKHGQDFVLNTLDRQIGQHSPNSFPLYDCVERLRLPLTLDHDHDHGHRNHQRAPHAVSSSTFSSAETDLSIKSPPRNRKMDCGLPPPYTPIEPSSSSSSSNLGLPPHLAWLQNVTISLYIDQEGFRGVVPAFKLVGYTKPVPPIYSSHVGMRQLLTSGNNGSASSTSIKQFSELIDQEPTDQDLAANPDVGMAEFIPFKRESFVFHHSALDTPPLIRRLSVNGDESRDYLSQHACLGIKSSGGFQVYAVRGSEVRRGSCGEDMAGRSEGGIYSSPIRFQWRFEYMVEDKRKADGTKAGGGEKFLTPLRFICSPGLLRSKQGRKVTVLNVWKKSIQPRLVASKVEPSSPTSPTTFRNQTHNLTGPISSPTSPKSVGVGPLRFPTAGKLWGKRAKSSPYRFDNGSDGSEENLLPSEDSGTRRRRSRPASTYASRMSQDVERSPQWWGGNRGRSADAIRLTSRDARPTTAGAERSYGRYKTEGFGREAMSEGENERVSSRPRFGYSGRPRTAR